METFDNKRPSANLNANESYRFVFKYCFKYIFLLVLNNVHSVVKERAHYSRKRNDVEHKPQKYTHICYNNNDINNNIRRVTPVVVPGNQSSYYGILVCLCTELTSFSHICLRARRKIYAHPHFCLRVPHSTDLHANVMIATNNIKHSGTLAFQFFHICKWPDK